MNSNEWDYGIDIEKASSIDKVRFLRQFYRRNAVSITANNLFEDITNNPHRDYNIRLFATHTFLDEEEFSLLRRGLCLFDEGSYFPDYVFNENCVWGVIAGHFRGNYICHSLAWRKIK